MIDEIVGTFIGRWYVTAFGIAFLVLALRHMGGRRTAIYTAVALIVGVAAENGSASDLGLPYGRYEFDPALRGEEIWVGDVPLMVSMSYTFMSYFAFATARLVVAGPWRTRVPSMQRLEYAVAVMLAVWMIWVVDPVSRLGEHFFLGHLFDYEGPGFWFGLHVHSQLGFTFTSAILVGTLTWLMRNEADESIERAVANPRLPAIGGYLGQVLFMAGTAWWVARTNADPAVVKEADALAGSAVLIFVPLLMAVAVHWRSLAERRARAPVSVAA
jgi:uncharacterized membrane protein